MWKRRRARKRYASFTPYQKSVQGLPWLMGLAVLALLVYFSFRSDWFNIKQVEIETEEAECVLPDQLKKTSGLLGQNFFFIDSAKIIKNLQKKFFCLRSVAVSKRFPDYVKLRLFLRQPAAEIVIVKGQEASVSALIEHFATDSAKESDHRYITDNEGIVFSKETGTTVPKIYTYNLKMSLGDKLEDKAMVALTILDKLKTLGINAKESWLVEDFLLVYPEVRPNMAFRLNNQVNIQLASLQLILDKAKIDGQDLEFIDLRFDKPVIKVKLKSPK